MSTRKLLTLSLFLLAAFFGNAQTSSTDWGWSWKDSSIVPLSGREQYSRFITNDYPYPPKPKNMWELGIGAGVSYIAGDVHGNAGFGGIISLRKALDHVFSIRASMTGLLNSGSPSAYGLTQGQLDYKNKAYQFSVDVLTSLNSYSNYRGNPKTNVYLLGGYSITGANVLIHNGGAQPGGYSIFYGVGQPNSQSGLIGTLGGAEVNKRHAYSVFHGLDLGGGISWKLSNKVNIGLEHKFTFTFSGYDYLDAVKAGNNDDYMGFTSFRVNINLGNPSKKVQPLWWLNGNNFIYNELNRPVHMKIPPPVLPDADGDGVTDQFDLEPNTPAGAAVDTHGRAKDTDGDGVPDYKDKEILTPLSCFPVNVDGVGTCPEPACCKEIRDLLKNQPVAAAPTTCTIGSLSGVTFSKNARLSADAQNTLAGVAATIKANPNCKVKVIGYGTASKSARQLSWDRVNAVIKYLVEKQGIAENRLQFIYEQDGNSANVDLQGTMDDGPNYVPAPHPELKSKG